MRSRRLAPVMSRAAALMVVRGRIHGQLQGLIRADLQEMDLDLSGNDLAGATCEEEGRKNGCLVGSVTIVWLTTEADKQPSCQCASVMSRYNVQNAA